MGLLVLSHLPHKVHQIVQYKEIHTQKEHNKEIIQEVPVFY